METDFLLKIFRILGDQTRLTLFNILLKGDHCNCELVALTGYSTNLISHHMHVLVDAELIDARRKADDARWIIYSINKDQLGRLRLLLGNWIDQESIPEREPCCQTKQNDLITEVKDESI